jgi:hypothetical protein
MQLLHTGFVIENSGGAPQHVTEPDALAARDRLVCAFPHATVIDLDTAPAKLAAETNQ